jgi:geranylgeranyl diphosphate synthase type I
MQERRARLRELLREGLARCSGALDAGSGQLVREQLDAGEAAAYETAALACLASAEAVGGSPQAAMPGAVSIVLLAHMGLVFTGLENAGGAAGLSTAWGMPRSLNAGDALFALAQQVLLAAPNELTAADRLAAVSLIDRGGRELFEALHGAGPDGDPVAAGQRALLPVALTLGGLLGGGGPRTRERLNKLGRAWSMLPYEELSRKLAADPSGWLTT